MTSMAAPSQRPMMPKEPGSFVASVVNQMSKAAPSRRRKTSAKKLGPGQDIFRNFQWTPPSIDKGVSKTPGRKPYDWSPKRSRELIKLIIHTDLKFDDIATAMKDENGDGPCESTCRNHWHEIFGYSPDIARLKNREGRERRLKEHVQAFEVFQKRQQSLSALSAADLSAHDSSNTSSIKTSSRNSSVQYADSAVQVDDDFDGMSKHTIEDRKDSIRGNGIAFGGTFVLTPPPNADQANGSYAYRDRLSSLREEGLEPGGLAPRHYSVAPSEISPNDISDLSERRQSQIPESPNQPIEEKESLPHGFIDWFKRFSIGSSAAHSSRQTSASSNFRLSRSMFNSIATSKDLGFHNEAVPEDAICTFLRRHSHVEEVPVGYVEELIERGADVNARNSKGETPLHLAVRLGAVVVCSLLLQKGADPEAKTYVGESVWSYGRRASKAVLNPEGSYDKREQLLRTMVSAHIEFLRATVKFNPDLVVDDLEKPKKRRTSDQSTNARAPHPSEQAWSRSGAARKKTKMNDAKSASRSGSMQRMAQHNATLSKIEEPRGMQSKRLAVPFFHQGLSQDLHEPAVPLPVPVNEHVVPSPIDHGIGRPSFSYTTSDYQTVTTTAATLPIPSQNAMDMAAYQLPAPTVVTPPDSLASSWPAEPQNVGWNYSPQMISQTQSFPSTGSLGPELTTSPGQISACDETGQYFQDNPTAYPTAAIYQSSQYDMNMASAGFDLLGTMSGIAPQIPSNFTGMDLYASQIPLPADIDSAWTSYDSSFGDEQQHWNAGNWTHQ